MLCAPAVVTAVHVSEGLANLVEDSVLVHTLVSLSITRSRIDRAYFSGAGIARLFANAGVAVVGPDIGITELVGPPSHIPTLLQHCK